MGAKIYLTFSTPQGQDGHELRWDVCPTSLADRWLAELVKAVRNPELLREQRFTGWANRPEDFERLVGNLNFSIAMINAFYGEHYQIQERAYLGMSQDVLNALHHHFEILMGQSWNRSELTMNIPDPVMVSIRLLNDHVHDYEAADRALQFERDGIKVSRSFQFQIVPYTQCELTREDLSSFSYACDFGDLVTNYCQLGKTWLEVWADKDEHILPENIAPLRYYASSFNAYFFAITQRDAHVMTENVKDFIRTKAEASGQKIDSNDPRHALGHAVYARLAKDSELLHCTEAERTALIRSHSNVSAIRIVSGGSEVHRVFSGANSYYGF